jgi:hypothetical protein
MALNPFVVQIEKKPGSSFGETMNAVRIWLDLLHVALIGPPRRGGPVLCYFMIGIRLTPSIVAAMVILVDRL